MYTYTFTYTFCLSVGPQLNNVNSVWGTLPLVQLWTVAQVARLIFVNNLWPNINPFKFRGRQWSVELLWILQIYSLVSICRHIRFEPCVSQSGKCRCCKSPVKLFKGGT